MCKCATMQCHLQAGEGIEALRQSVDSVIVIPNDRLLDVASEGTALQDAFGLADDVLRQGVQVRSCAVVCTLHLIGFSQLHFVRVVLQCQLKLV